MKTSPLNLLIFLTGLFALTEHDFTTAVKHGTIATAILMGAYVVLTCMIAPFFRNLALLWHQIFHKK